MNEQSYRVANTDCSEIRSRIALRTPTGEKLQLYRVANTSCNEKINCIALRTPVETREEQSYRVANTDWKRKHRIALRTPVNNCIALRTPVAEESITVSRCEHRLRNKSDVQSYRVANTDCKRKVPYRIANTGTLN